jgi:hypothetical protein
MPAVSQTLLAIKAGIYAFVTSPAQSRWPHRHTTSVPLPMPSQWALQYFDPSDGVQLQAGFAHFFGFAMMHLPRSVRCSSCSSLGRNGPDALYAGIRCAGAGKRCCPAVQVSVSTAASHASRSLHRIGARAVWVTGYRNLLARLSAGVSRDLRRSNWRPCPSLLRSHRLRT